MAAALFNLPTSRIIDANGIADGSTLTFYDTGTLTKRAIYTTSALSVEHPNPLTVASGAAVPSIYLDDAYTYRCIVKNAAGTTIDDIDPYTGTSASGVFFAHSGTGAVTRTVQAKAREIARSVTDYGVATSASAATNLANLKLALAACSAGDVLDVPPGTYSIDTSGLLADAATVSTAITIKLRGTLQASSQAIGSTPAPILYVTADNVTIEGDGKFLGPGTFNSVNTGTDDTCPALVRVTGANFTMRGVTVEKPFKIGVQLYGCFNALIEGCKFTGGPTTYTDTAHFGIRMSNSGGRHTITGNRFFPDGSGGMFVQCIFSNGASNCLIEGNYAYRPYEKLVYLSGDEHLVTGNTVIGNTGTIAGTNQTGTVGTVYRCDGNRNRIAGNYSIHGGGATCRGAGNDVSGNTFLKAGQGGVGITGTSAAIDDTKVSDNLITCGDLAGVLVTHGINIATATGTNRRVAVSNNTIEGFGISDPIANIAAWSAAATIPAISAIKPTVGNSRYYTTANGGTTGGSEPTWPTTPGATVTDNGITWTCASYETTNAAINMDGSLGQLDACTVSGNNTTGGYYGLKTNALNASKVSGNLFGATNTGVIETSGGTNRYEFNTVAGAGTEKSGLAATSLWINYATGTFEPVISDGTNNATMGGAGSNNIRWTRIGNTVTISGNIASSALGSVTGAVRVTGAFPTAASGASSNACFSIGYAGGLAITAGHAVTALIQPGNAYLDLYLWDATTGTTALQATEWTDDGNMLISGSYHAAP